MKEKVGKGFVATTPARNENVGSYPKCAKYSVYHLKSGHCRLCFNCQKPGHFARDFRATVRMVTPVRMGNNQRVCYECGSSEHLRNTCPKLNRAPGQAGNHLTLEGNRNTQNNRNQARGKAFSVNAVNALQDPNVVTGTKTLMSTKAEELELSDIPIVRDLVEVFPEDLSGLPLQRQVEFHIDLILGVTPVAKSPYRLAPSEMQELSEQL
ncbi:putative reverse transcriptase domain-containing protein [Tanacetum coccineum]